MDDEGDGEFELLTLSLARKLVTVLNESAGNANVKIAAVGAFVEATLNGLPEHQRAGTSLLFVGELAKRMGGGD